MNETLKQAAAETGKNVERSVRGLVDAAADQAQLVAEQAKSSAAGEIAEVADVLRSAAGKLQSGSPSQRTLGQIASGLADASESIEGKDLGELVQITTDLARRNPVLFVGGAMLVGFAAARFLKAAPVEEPYHPTSADRSMAEGYLT